MSDVALILLCWLFLLVWLVRHLKASVGRSDAVPPRMRTAQELQAERLVPTIRTPHEAVIVGNRWLRGDRPSATVTQPLQDAGEDAPLRLPPGADAQSQALHRACLSRLELLEALDSGGPQRYAMALIQPDQTFARPFVVEGDRRSIRSRHFVISIETRYEIEVPGGAAVSSAPDPDPISGPERVETVHSVLKVTPNPAMVTLFAVAGAAAGTGEKEPGSRGGCASVSPAGSRSTSGPIIEALSQHL